MYYSPFSYRKEHMKVGLFILQNGYHSEKYQYRNIEEWFCDLKRSYSGRRLAKMIPSTVDAKIINASPIIGKNAKSYFEADLQHIKDMIAKYKPDFICACGEVATKGCEQLKLNFIKLPHPAWRQLTNVRINEIKETLDKL